MKWIKASERLPERPGKENMVVVRFGDNLQNVATGFRNYSEDNPQLYIDSVGLGLTTTAYNGDMHSSVSVGQVEWLDEQHNDAIAFLEWVQLSPYWKLADSAGGKWFKTGDHNDYTTADLYEIFKKEQP